MHAWYTFIFVFSVSMVSSHTLLARQAMRVHTLPIRVVSSASRDRLLEMVEPRYVKFSTTSRVWSLMVIAGALLTSCVQALAKQVVRHWRASSVQAVRAASLANSISLTSTLRT